MITIEEKPTRALIHTPVPQQTPFWALFKQQQGVSTAAFDIHTEGNGDDLLVLYHHVGDGLTIGYVPYGPTMRPAEQSRGTFLEELSESLRPSVPSTCIALRYDLMWESPWAHEEDRYTGDGSWIGPPDRRSQEIRVNFTTQNWNLRKSQTDILPADTLFVDLERSDEQLLMQMRSKTRYNIRLSKRRGVSVRTGGPGDLSLWYELYSQTCRRNSIFLHDQSFFTALIAAQRLAPGEDEGVELLIAEHEDVPTAAMFLLYSGSRATYLYGASSDRGRESMATYALQWEALRRAKQQGCSLYDMFGTAPDADPSHPMYGLHRFKKGFGGRPYHRMGCWDYPLDAERYRLYQTAEMLSQGYHL